VDLVNLQQYKTTREIHDLLLFQAKKAEHFFQQACEKVSASTQQKYASMIVRCQIALATLREIKKVKFSVLENYICLTPLRYWWIALKMRVF
jgi:phytoene synthase